VTDADNRGGPSIKGWAKGMLYPRVFVKYQQSNIANSALVSSVFEAICLKKLVYIHLSTHNIARPGITQDRDLLIVRCLLFHQIFTCTTRRYAHYSVDSDLDRPSSGQTYILALKYDSV
jgi:hypothetical protein